MHRLRACVAPFLIATLGLDGCAATRDDERDDGVGIVADVGASQETRSATGVASWKVTSPVAGTVDVTAVGERGEVIGQIHGTVGDTVTVQVVGSGHRLVIDPDAGVGDDQLDANELAMLDRFRDDAATLLADPGFRDAAGCGLGSMSGGAAGGAMGGGPGSAGSMLGGALGGIFGTLGQLTKEITKRTLVGFGRAMADVGVQCSGLGKDASDDAGSDSSGDDAEASDSRGSDGGSGYGSDGGSGYGSDGGSGYGSDGGSGYGGDGSSGYGSGGGYGSDGGGYGGYGGSGYGYAPLPDPSQRWSADAIPHASDAIGLGFRDAFIAPRTRPDARAWDMRD